MPRRLRTTPPLPRAGWAWLAALLALASVTVAAGPPPNLDYTVRVWRLEDGLPRQTISALCQTRDHFVWIGTDEGAIRFDGVHFELFDSKSTPAFRINRVSQFSEDEAGRLWIATAGGGVVCKDGPDFRHYGPEEGLENQQVRAIHAAHGRIWAATDGGGLYVGNGARFEPVPIPNDRARFLNGVVEAPDGSLVISTADAGVWRRRGGEWQLLTHGATPFSGTYTTLALGASGRVWVASTRGLWEAGESGLVPFPGRPETMGEVIYALAEPAPGEWWMGTPTALVHEEGGRREELHVGAGFSTRGLSLLLRDHEGSVWAAADGIGLAQLKHTRFVGLGTPEGLSHDEVTTVVESRTGDLWVATAGGLNRVGPAGIRHFSKADGLPDDYLYSLHEDPDGVLWIGTRVGGVVQLRGDRVVPVPPERLPYRGAVWCMAGDGRERLWIGGRTGLAILRNGALETLVTGKDGLSHDDVRAICPDHDGNLWVGTSYGLNRLRDGRVQRTWAEFEGRPVDTVVSLRCDAAGAMWVGILEHGLLRIRDGKWSRLTTAEGLPDNSIHQILDDGLGRWWISCGRGVFSVPKTELDEVADGKRRRVAHAELYGRESGLRSEEMTSTVQPAGARTRDGRLWWPSNRGLAVVDPSRPLARVRAPRPMIESAVIDGEHGPEGAKARTRSGTLVAVGPDRVRILETSADGASRWLIREPGTGLKIPPGTDRLESHFTAPGFQSPEGLRFRSRLEGYDRDWSDNGTRRIAYYSHVPPGRYTFRVEAVGEGGVRGESPAALEVRLLPYWWQTAEFRIAAGALVAAALLWVARLRLRAFRRHGEQQERFARQLIQSQEAERRRLAGELHDSLTQTLLVVKNRAWMGQQSPDVPERVARQLREISEAAVLALDEVRSLTHALRPPELDRLGLTRAFVALGERLAESGGPEVTFRVADVDGVLPPEQEINLYRIAQEALNNSLKHARAGRLELQLRREDSRLVLSVEDDGQGFDPMASRPGLGLSSMAERARILRGSLTIDARPGQGTRIGATVPVARRPA